MVFQDGPVPVSTTEFIANFQEVLLTYPDHGKYLDEDRLVNLGKNLSSNDGPKAFMEIEKELLAYNTRLESIQKMKP